MAPRPNIRDTAKVGEPRAADQTHEEKEHAEKDRAAEIGLQQENQAEEPVTRTGGINPTEKDRPFSASG